MIEEFYFQLQTHMYHGVRYSAKLPELIRDKGYRCPLILVDEGVSNTAYFHEVWGAVQAGFPSAKFMNLRGTEEPSYDYLDYMASRIRPLKDVDLLIGIGGGSVLDMTKAIAVLQTNPGYGVEYRGFDKVKKPGVPSLLIPTTAGTASEVTINAVFTDKSEKKKLGINGHYMHATYAILDAQWTMSCPIKVAVSAGVDAMVHTLESFSSPKANVATRSFSQAAFDLLIENLSSLKSDPNNMIKRQRLLVGSYFAGIALFNSGSGAAGAMSYPIGVHYHVPHGIGGGIFITSVMKYNIERGYTDYGMLLKHRGGSCDLKQQSIELVRQLDKIFNLLGVPQNLSDWGITKDNVGEVAELMVPLQGAFDQNPVTLKAPADVRGILEKHVC